MFITDERITTATGVPTTSPVVMIADVGERAAVLLESVLRPYFNINSSFDVTSDHRSVVTIRITTPSTVESTPVDRHGYSFGLAVGRPREVSVFAATEIGVTRGALAVTRALFKSVATAVGGVNLHAGCVARHEDGVLIIGERMAGKTTAILAAVDEGAFDFLANDQVVLLPGVGGGPARVLGYPALVKVRESSGRLIRKIPWDRALWTQPDDAQPGASARTAVFAPIDLYAGVSGTVIPSADLAAVVRYIQSSDSGELTCEDATAERGALWAQTAALPLNVAYERKLVDVVNQLVGRACESRRLMTGWPSATRITQVRCGVGRISRLGKILEAIVESVRESE